MSKYDDMYNQELNKITSKKNGVSSYSPSKTKTNYADMYNEELNKITANKKKGIYIDKPYNAEDYFTNKNNDTIQGLQNNLLSNGVEVPQMLDTGKKWYEQIFDPISSLQYGVARGVKNLVDENNTTNFGQGFKEGVSAGFDADGSEKQNRTSWKDVLDTLLNSSNETTRNVTAVANNVLNPFAWGDALTSTDGAVETAKKHTGFTGFLGDALLDPTNLIGGLGATTKVLSKGSKITKTIGSVEEAAKVLDKLGVNGGAKESEALLNKASKMLGQMPDYNGLYLGTKNHNIGFSADTMGKFADSILGKGLGALINIPVKPIEKAKKFIADSSVGKGFSDWFIGGKNRALIRDSKANPENAIMNTAYADYLGRRENLKNMSVEDIVSNAKTLQKQVGNNNGNVLKTLQTKDKQILEQIGTKEVDKLNPNFNTELTNHWGKIALERDRLELQLKDMKDKTNGLDINSIKEVNNLREQIDLLDKIPDVESISFSKNLKSSGLDLSKLNVEAVNSISPMLHNPVDVRNMPIEDFTNHLKMLRDKEAITGTDEELSKMALLIKGSADNTIKEIEKQFPEFAPYYAKTTVQDGREVAKHGMGKDNLEEVRTRNAEYDKQKQEALSANTDTSAYGLNFSNKDTQDMSLEELSKHRETLQGKVDQYTKEGKTKLLEKAQADVDVVDKQLSDIKASNKAPAPNYSKESPVGLKSDFERINAVKDLPDVFVKKVVKDLKSPTKAEIKNLENIKFHYDNLISKGFYPDAIQKMSVGAIINRSKEFLNPDLGRALALIPTPTKNGINEETYTKLRKSVADVFKRGINPYNKKRMVNAKDLEDFVNEFVDKNTYDGLHGTGNIEKFLDEGGTVSKKGVHTDKPVVDTQFDTDKFGQNNENAKQETVYGKKRQLVDINNPGVKRTVEEIQKYVKDFDIDAAKNMTAHDLNNLMNGLKRGKINPEDLSAKKILDSLGSSNNPIAKLANKSDIYKNVEYGNVKKGNKEFLTFDTPNGTVNVDATSNPKAVKKLEETVMNRPEDLKGVQQNVNTTLLNGDIGDIVHDKGNLKAQGVYLNDEGKNVILSDKNTPNNFEGTLNHEATHAFGNSAWHADRAASSIRKDMFNWNEEQIKEADKLFKTVGRTIGKDKGNITTYLDVLKSTKANKGTMNQESLAELGSIFLHSDPMIRAKANELFPQGSKSMYDLIEKLPKKDLGQIIPKGVSAKAELTAKLEGLQDIIKTMDKIKPEDLVNSNALQERFDKINELLKNSEAHKEYFKETYKDVPEFIKASEPVMEVKDTISAFNGLDEQSKRAAEFIRSEFKKMGIEENIDPKHLEGLYNYFPRVLNFDLRDKPKYKTMFDDLHNPTNQNAKSREFMVGKTIEEVNKIMKEKHNIDNFFENNVVRAYVDRALNHNEFMFKKDVTEKSMNLFGKQIDKTAYEGLTPEAKQNLYKEVQDMFDSGEYDVVRLDDKLQKVDANVVDGEALNKAKENVNAFNPYVSLNPKDINIKEIFENAQQPIWLVKKDTHAILKDVAVGQFRQSNNGLLKAIDKFNSLWKTGALMTMSFNVNNAVGNTFNNYLAVGAKVLNPNINKNAFQIELKNPMGNFKGKSNKEWKKIAQEYGVLGHDFNSEVQDFRKGLTDSVTKTPLQKLKSGLNPLSQNFAMYKGARSISSKIESQARLVNFLANIDNGKSIQESADMVNKFLFDYNDLTDFEQGTMKRIVPFYTWMRKNMPLQVENLFKQPTKYGSIYRGQRDVAKPESEEQRALRPSYLESAIHLGDGKYANLNLPYNDLKKMTSPREMFGSINPFAKLAVELITNKNTYFDTPIAKQPGEKVAAPSYLKMIAKDTPKGKMIDAKLKYALDTLLPVPKNISKTVDSGKMSMVTGINTYETDEEQLKQQAISDYIKKLTDIETNAKKEGKLTKTAAQIQKEVENTKEYEKIQAIYEEQYLKRQAIYDNNYVIKKKK